jgi:hypothetical protein
MQTQPVRHRRTRLQVYEQRRQERLIEFDGFLTEQQQRVKGLLTDDGQRRLRRQEEQPLRSELELLVSRK